MSELIKPCMGGWCHLRNSCLHYTSPNWREAPADRLCDKGGEHEMFFSRKAKEIQATAEVVA